MRAPAIDEALAAIKTAIRAKSKGKRKQDPAGDVLGKVASYLVFLKGSTLSVDVERKLSEVFRHQLSVLYAAFPQPAFELASALCKAIHEDKIIKAVTTGKSEECLRWEGVLNALLSGILDHLDEHQEPACKEHIGSALYPGLCFILSSSSASHMSPELRCTGYSVLSESAEGHRPNQKRLLNKEMLGGAKLGSMLWRTRDYLAMESILNLFARMIPPSKSTATGRAERRAFIRSVFVDSNPDDAQTGEQLADMVEHLSTPDWDRTAIRIVETLAASNIGYPQPFSISDVVVGGEAKPSDRIFVDERGLMANVLVKEDLFDSLTAAYSTITSVEISRRICATLAPNNSPIAHVHVTLSAPPKLGREPINSQSPELSLQLTFALAGDQVDRFQTALKSRGVGNVSLNASTKQSILSCPATLEMDMAGNLIGTDEMENRVENLTQLYGTNDPSDDQDEIDPEQFTNGICEEAPCIDPALLTLPHPTNTSPTRNAEPQTVDTSPVTCAAVDTTTSHPEPAAATLAHTEALAEATMTDMYTPVSSARSAVLKPPATPVRRTVSQVLRESAFGGSDDELSSVDSPLGPPKASQKPLPRPLPKPVSVDKPATTAKAPKGRRVLDSDDELAVSTPAKALARSTKKAVPVLISDDEIEDVLPSTRTLVSRTRSALPMTPVTPTKMSSSRRQSVASRAASMKNASDGAAGKAPDAGAAGSRKRSTKAPVHVDLDLTDPDEKMLLVKSVPAGPTVSGERDEASGEAKPGNTGTGAKQVRMSSPPVQPAKKSVKNNMRKKNEPMPDAAAEVLSAARNSKRKRSVGEEPVDDGAKSADTKRPKLAPPEKAEPVGEPRQEAPLAKPDSARAQKRYRAKKARASPMHPTPSPPPGPTAVPAGTFDFDMIPDPAASAVKTEKSAVSLALEKDVGAEKDVPAAAKVTRSTRKRAGAAATQQALIKTPVAEAPPEVKEKLESRRKPAPRRMNGAKREPAVQVGPEQSVVDEEAKEKNEGDEKVRKSEKKVAAKSKSKKAPWKDLHEKPAEPKPSVDPDPPLPLLPTRATTRSTPPLQSLREDPALEVPDVQLAVEDDEDIADVTLVAPTPCKIAGKEADTFVHEVMQTETCGNFDAKEDSPMKFALPSPAPPTAAWAENARRAAHREASRPALPGQSVTFQELPSSDRISTPILKPKPVNVRQAPRDKTPRIPALPKASAIRSDRARAAATTAKTERAESGDIMGDIATVLQDIQEAILYKIHNKVETVRHDIRRGRDLLLADAAADLEDMRAECIDHYNRLIEFESEYASFGRNLIHGLDDLAIADRNIQAEIEKAIATINRGSIVKHVPTSLFGPKLPASISRFVS